MAATAYLKPPAPRMFFRIALAAIVSAGVSLAAIATFSVLSGVMLTPERAHSVALRAFERRALPWTEHPGEDFFTECAMLQMQLLRPRGAWAQAIDTRFRMEHGEHPCATLARAVMRIDLETMPPVRSYFNYPFGPRHIEAAVLSVIHYPRAVIVYSVASYASLVLLLFVMVWRDHRAGLLLAPIPIVLALGFSLHLFGGNLAHAPGYILGWLELAAFVAAGSWLQSFPRRIAVFTAIGFLAAYTDLLSGVTPTLVAMTIVINHFFYVRPRRERHLERTIANLLAVFACFVFASLLLNGIRLELLIAQGVVEGGRSIIDTIWNNLMSKSATDIGLGSPLTLGVVLGQLLELRHQMTYGGETVATWLLGAGAFSWLMALYLGPMAAIRNRCALPALVDILVLLAASLGIFVWYAALPAHTYVHALFMVRLLALPCAFGIAALLVGCRNVSFRA